MAQITDPVCGMTLDSNAAEGSSTYQGKTYYFCSTEDKEKFDRNPSRYATAGAESARRHEERPEA